MTQVRPAVQALPQAPQFVALVCRFTHCVPHCVVPGPQTQRPALHTLPPVQITLQPPQLVLLV
jgi:hypothetical protein